MKTAVLSLYMLGLLALNASAESFNEQNSELSDLVGNVFLALSKDNVVAGQYLDVPTIWANAKLGRVEHPNGMLPSMGTRFETEYIPGDSGIVLRFYGPDPLHATQKDWSTWHNKEKRNFEIVVNLPDKKFIGMAGSYGSSFPTKTIDDLISLSKGKSN
ncbi:MAG: hypothetical protein PHD76_11250 [Methylacidiphilales bacterium]|nr:hypothetical protein [Candidatus Methylacidiphilales bacterium]